MNNLQGYFTCYSECMTCLRFTCTFKHLTVPLKLGELEVLSTKIFFKVFDKSKSRPIEKMRMQDLLVFGSR